MSETHARLRREQKAREKMEQARRLELAEQAKREEEKRRAREKVKQEELARQRAYEREKALEAERRRQVESRWQALVERHQNLQSQLKLASAAWGPDYFDSVPTIHLGSLPKSNERLSLLCDATESELHKYQQSLLAAKVEAQISERRKLLPKVQQSRESVHEFPKKLASIIKRASALGIDAETESTIDRIVAQVSTSEFGESQATQALTEIRYVVRDNIENMRKADVASRLEEQKQRTMVEYLTRLHKQIEWCTVDEARDLADEFLIWFQKPAEAPDDLEERVQAAVDSQRASDRYEEEQADSRLDAELALLDHRRLVSDLSEVVRKNSDFVVEGDLEYELNTTGTTTVGALDSPGHGFRITVTGTEYSVLPIRSIGSVLDSQFVNTWCEKYAKKVDQSLEERNWSFESYDEKLNPTVEEVASVPIARLAKRSSATQGADTVARKTERS